MSSTKDQAKTEAREQRLERMLLQIGENEDRLHREQVKEWILELAAERRRATQPPQ